MNDRHFSFTFVLIVLLFACSVFADGLWRPPGVVQGRGFLREVLQSSPRRTVIRFEILSADTGTAEIYSEPFDYFNIPRAAHGCEIGQPDLPAFSFLIAAGTGAINYSISSAETAFIDDIRLAPKQPPIPEVSDWVSPPLQIDRDIYSSETPFPTERLEVSESIGIRGADCRRIKVFPVKYYPKERRLEVTYRFTLTIEHSPPEPVPERLATPNWNRFLKGVLVNADALEIPDSRLRPESPTGADMLIITEPSMAEPAESLAAWKTFCGIDTEVKLTTETGTSASAIQDYIQNAYDTWTPAPEFLLIIGDAENVPPVYTSTSHPYHGTPTGTDLYYATVSGTDYYPDIFYGRIPAQSHAQAMNFVNKIIEYEGVAHELGSDFYTSVACAAYFQDGDMNGYADRRFTLTSEEFRDYLTSEGYNVDRLYCTESSVNPTNWNNGSFGDGSPIPTELLRSSGFEWDADAGDILAAVDEGRFLLTHRDHGYRGGWGDPAFSKSDINLFSNGHKLPVVMSFNCMSGWFDNETDDPSDGTAEGDECFCEAFVRKYPGGAVGVIGATRVSYSGYNDFLARGFIDGIWDDFDGAHSPASPTDYRTGIAMVWGKIYMEETWAEWNLEFEIFEWFGDPSMQMFTAPPEIMDVDLPLSMFIGSSACDIACDTDGALVTLIRDGEIIARESVSGGSAHMVFSPIDSPDTITATITKHNCVPFIGQIPITYAAHVSVVPGTLDVLVPDSIIVTVFDTLDDPYPGVKLTLDGFSIAETLITGSTGVEVFHLTPPYAETLIVTGERPGGGMIFLNRVIVLGGAAFLPTSLQIGSPDAHVMDSLAVNIDGYIRAELPSSPFYWKLYGSGIGETTGTVTSGDTVRIEIKPRSEDDFCFVTAKEGYAVGFTDVKARNCYGPLDGSVTDSTGTVPAANIEIFVYPEDADTSIEDPSFVIETNPGGHFDVGSFVPCGTYDIYPFGFGWGLCELTLVHHVDGDYDIMLPRASTSPLSGTVTDSAGNPVQAEIVLLHPNGMQLRRTSSDDAGEYYMSAIPYFDYTIGAFARGYRTYLSGCPIHSAPTTRDIVLEEVDATVLLISNGGYHSSDSLEEHLESFGLTVHRTDYVPGLDTLEKYEFVVYSTGDNTDESVVNLYDAWNLLEAHRNGIKIIIEGGDIAHQYMMAPSMPIVLLDSLFMIMAYTGDELDTTITLNVAPAEARALAHNPDTPPRAINLVDPGSDNGYMDIIVPKTSRLLYYKAGSANHGVVVYYADSLGAGVHSMAHIYFKYPDALEYTDAAKRILRNIVEWLRAPDFEHGVITGRAVVPGGNPENIQVSGGGATDTTQEDGRFTLTTDPGVFHINFSAPHINDTTYWGITLAPGEVRVGFIAVLSPDAPVAETGLPTSFEVPAIYPNPFNATVAFEIRTPKAEKINITVYDLMGRKVYSDSEVIDGKEVIYWNTTKNEELTSGLYFYRISDGNSAFRGKVMLLK